MKLYRTIMMLSAACLALSACAEKENPVGEGEGDPTMPDTPEVKGPSFEKGQQATLTVNSSDDTKALGALGDDDKIHFTWQEGDKISVTVGDKSSAFVLIEGAGKSSGKFSGTMPGSGDSFSVQYPVGGDSGIDLSSQTYSENKLPEGKMWAKADGCVLGKPLKLKPQFSALRLNLWGENKTVGKIVVTNTSASPNLTYTLNCGTEGIQIGTEANPTSFLIVVPVGEGGWNFDADVYGISNNRLSGFRKSSSSKFVTGGVLNMPAKGVLTPYVDFAQKEALAPNNFPGSFQDVSIGEKSISFTATGGSGCELLFLPIMNLETNHWYTITFGESLKMHDGSVWKWCDDNLLSYSCSVVGKVEQPNPLLPWIVNIQEKKFLWTHSDELGPNAKYDPVSEASTTFYASAETMYWVWDLSRCPDNKAIDFIYTLTGTGIRQLIAPSTPYVDFPNATLYGFRSTGGDYVSYKRYADYNKFEFQVYGVSSVCEKVNIPVRGLEDGKKYKLYFKYDIAGVTNLQDAIIDNELDLCCGVVGGIVSDTKNGTLHNEEPYNHNNYITSPLPSLPIEGCVEFTATAETMYWVWSQSNLKDNERFVQTFSNVKIEPAGTE